MAPQQVLRCKNFFTLGLMAWLYHRPTDPILDFIEARFGRDEQLANANARALKAAVRGRWRTGSGPVGP